MNMRFIWYSFIVLISTPLFAMHYGYLVECVERNAHREATQELIRIFDNLGKKSLLPQKKDLEYLINAGADANATNPEGRSLLQLAVSNDYLEGVKVLLTHGADPNQIVRKIEKPSQFGIPFFSRLFDAPLLIYAIQNSSSIEIISSLIKAGADLNAKDELGSAALFYAVSNNDFALAKLLLEKGANPNIQNRTRIIKITPLFDAVRFDQTTNIDNDIKIIKMLIEYGADVNFIDTIRPGLTVLSTAIQNPNARINVPALLAIVRVLLKAGADPNLDGSLFYALKEFPNEELIQLLLQAGADPNLNVFPFTTMGYAREQFEKANVEHNQAEIEKWQRIIGWLEKSQTVGRTGLKKLM